MKFELHVGVYPLTRDWHTWRTGGEEWSSIRVWKLQIACRKPLVHPAMPSTAQARNGLARPGLRSQGSAGARGWSVEIASFNREANGSARLGQGCQSAMGREFRPGKQGVRSSASLAPRFHGKGGKGKRKDLPTRSFLPFTRVPSAEQPPVARAFRPREE
jgi:hypothetical protein